MIKEDYMYDKRSRNILFQCLPNLSEELEMQIVGITQLTSLMV